MTAPPNKHMEPDGTEDFNYGWTFRQRLYWYINKRLKEQKLIEGRDKITSIKKEILGVSLISCDHEGGPFAKKGQSSPLSRKRIRELHFALKVKPEHFLLTQKEEKEWMEKGEEKTDKILSRYFTRSCWDELSRLWAPKPRYEYNELIPNDEGTFGKNLKHEYEKLKPYYLRAEDSIIAHELLFKGHMTPIESEPHEIAQSVIHEAIDVALERAKANNPKFRYQRFFYLSASDRLFPKNEENAEQCKLAFVAEASLPTLVHLVHCQHDYGAPNGHNSLCSFKIIGAGSPLRHRVIVDNKYMLTEDYLFRKMADKGIKTFPDRISVIKISKNTQTHELSKMVSRSWGRFKTHKFTPFEILFWLEKAKKHAEQQENVRKVHYRDMPDKNDTIDYLPLKKRMEATRKLYEKQIEYLDGKIEGIKRQCPERRYPKLYTYLK